MLDSVDVGVAINLGLYSGRTVGRTAVYFIRKLLRVGCRLRLRRGGAKPGGFAYAGEGHARERVPFCLRVDVPAKAPAFALFWPETAVAFGYECPDSLKHTKLYRE